MSVVDALRAGRALIADKSKWTQGHVARNAQGHHVAAEDEEAVCFCAIGAAIVSAHAAQVAPYYVEDALTQAARSVYNDTGLVLDNRSGLVLPAAINDGHIRINGLAPHDAVLLMYDRAIERESAGQS